MSDKQTEPNGNPSKIKHTLIWDGEVWAETERAAARLAADTGTEVTIPNYIRGTMERRNREILGNVL